jgi:hypothetical protein
VLKGERELPLGQRFAEVDDGVVEGAAAAGALAPGAVVVDGLGVVCDGAEVWCVV